MALVAADLFCGAGGFSEGFVQAGFRVTVALDIWPPAIVTHKKNHPDTKVLMRDLLTFEPEAVGPVDVLIGSPPCTEFSFANRGGSGDIEAGMRLVYRFLRFVYELSPRYWVMENIPRVLDFLPDEVPLRYLGIDKRGYLSIPTKSLLTAANHGTPQKRVRAFSGDFPVVPETHAEVPQVGRTPWRTLGEIVEGLPDPLRSYEGEVTDPTYGFKLPSRDLTDHFGTGLRLSKEEILENRRAKESHSWYGRMTFPDRLDRPARTVMATNMRVARESIVVRAGARSYRHLSIREASSTQGFPITYQWWGSTPSQRYMLIGNAVAPPVAFAIGRAILAASELPIPDRPHVVTRDVDPPPAAAERKRPRLLPVTRRFREHVPGAKVPGFRVDLDNQGQRRDGQLVEWQAVLYCGGGKTLKRRPTTLRQALKTLHSSTPERKTQRFTRSVARELRGIPDASTLQRIATRRERGEVTPYVVLERIADVVARHFGDETAARRNGGLVPPRIAAALVATAYACAVANGRTSELRAITMEA